MPAILVVSNMKSGLPKPVHSALPMPLPPAQAAGSLRGSAASLIPLRSPVRRPGTRAVPRQSRTEKGKPGDPQIYTDWANHYLAKSGGKRLIRNLQQDVSDGVLLAEIIQVVANEKIADINDYPESRSQMIENIDACLVFLAAKGVNINGLRAEEIRSGNLKAILGLFFSLSRFKQQQRPAPPQAPPAGGPAQTPHPPRPTVSPAHRPQAEAASSHPSQDCPQRTAAKLCVAHRKTSSRLPGPSVRVGAVGSDAKPRGGATGTTSASTPSSSSSSSNRRSQSFNSGERLKPTHPACALHEDGVRTPPSMAEDGAPYVPDLPTPTPTSSSSSAAPASSSKPWRSKSLSTKHTATSSLLSVKQPCPSLEVPPKVIAQKSMLEKLKLFNSSRAPSRASSRASLAEDPEAPDPGRAETCPGHGDSDLGSHQQPAPSLASSPKLALKGIAQRTIVRALANKKISAKALEKGKEKGKPREKEKLPKKSSMVEQDPVKEEVKQEEHAGAETRRSSSVPKGSKTVSSAQPHSSIPKPAGGKGSGAGSKRTMSPSGGKEGDRVHGPRSGTGLSVHKGQLDSRRSSSSSSLGSSEGRCPQRSSGGTTTQSVPGNSIAVGNAVSNGASVQLPQPQPPYSHPNTATVAPFMYRSHTDMDGTALAEAVRDRGEGSLLHSNTIHTSLECLTGEDPEARRLRTVKNIADLRQNLEETMSSLRGTQISHSTLETTFDSSVTTEVTTAAGRSLVHLGGWHAQTLPWRLSSSSPRLQAGDAPSSGSGYSQRSGSGSGSRLASPNGGRYAGRQSGARHGAPRGPELTDTGEELEGITVETTMGYMSDGDVLGKNPRVDSVTSGYMTDGGLSVYPRRLNRLPDSMSTVKETMHPAPPTNQADTDSWDDSSSVSSGISDTLDTDDINTSSSLSSFVNTPSTPHRDLEEQLQTDAEKRSDHGLTWCSEEVRRADAGSDSGVKMDAGSRWCSHPSDISDESDRGSSGRKTPSVSHTGSWRRGMSAQVGITSPRSKAPPLIGCGSLKTHGTGKTDDAKVSEKVCLSPRPNGIHASSSDEARKPPSSARTPTNTFGFKKPLGGMATITASGAVVTSGSATLGKLPKSAGYGGSRLVGRQSSVDDGYLPPNARSLLQYRSLPRPSRSTGTTARYASRTASAGLEPKAIATPPNPRGRGTARPTAEALAPSVTNRTDREKGVCLDSEGLASGQSKASGSGGQDAMAGQCQASRQAGGSMSSPTLRRLFGSKPNGKQAPVTTAENMRNSTVISNPHAPESPPASGPGSAVSPWSSRDGALQPVPDARDASLGKEDAQAPSLHRTSSSRAGVSDSPLPSPAASPKFSRNTLPRRQDRYAHLPQSRGQEEMRDWLRSHSVGGLQESGGVALFPQASNLSSPSGTRLNFNTLGSPTAMAQRSANGLANQDGPYDPHSDPRLRNSSMSLEEKGRTMSNSGSFRDGLEEVHGSCLSLVSSSSSVYSTPEEKSQSEIRKLRRELEASQEKVSALTTQLSANAHLVAAFEQSLGNMTIRLQSLTLTAEQKDSELSELRKTIEHLRKQNTATQAAINGVINSPEPTPKGSANGSPQSPRELRIRRQPSSDSVSSMASGTSLSSVGSASLEFDAKNKNKKKKNWLRSSFKQAFGKKREAPKSASSHSDIEEMTDSSLPSSPKLPYNGPGASVLTKTSHSTSLISECADSDAETVMQLRSELRDKEMKLTDIRLEALSSAHQLDQLRESMTRMQAEVEQLKVENDRLKMESQGSSSSRTASQTSISPTSVGLTSQLSLTESTSLDMLLEDSGDGSSRKEGRHVKVVVTLEQEAAWREECRPRQFLIGCIGVSGKTKWDVLDGVVRRLFKEYIIHVDPLGQLGLSADSVQGYGIGDVQRSCEADTPELLPCGYLVGESDTISLSLKGVEANSQDSVAFETLIPKPIFQRYVSQLTEHRRIIFSGPSGTGKTFLATRLAEHMVQREGHNLTDGVIATFNVDQKSSKELKQYLTNLAEQCTSSMGQTLDVPLVVILDNLHQASSLPELLNGLLSSRHHRCPYIIGTMSQATSSTPNLQLHHNFRWVLCANHTEPVKGFLGRFLRRKLMETEISSRVRNSELVKVIDWVPCVWQHLNRFLETHSSSDVTIGPRLFLSCPMDVDGSRVWFTDLWNYSIIPYVLEAVREGLQLYGRRAAWEDPAKWVMESYPWAAGPRQHDWPPLLHLRPEDVGFDGYSLARDGGPRTQPPQEETGGDPLMNMLMRLKEAAHCASPHSYDSDSNSNDHHDDVVESLESTL